MIAVIFESWPTDGRTEEYLDLAAGLRPQLDTIDGTGSGSDLAPLRDAHNARTRSLPLPVPYRW
jgi:heme-degrading monooxygenase HmoA